MLRASLVAFVHVTNSRKPFADSSQTSKRLLMAFLRMAEPKASYSSSRKLSSWTRDAGVSSPTYGFS